MQAVYQAVVHDVVHSSVSAYFPCLCLYVLDKLRQVFPRYLLADAVGQCSVRRQVLIVGRDVLSQCFLAEAQLLARIFACISVGTGNLKHAAVWSWSHHVVLQQDGLSVSRVGGDAQFKATKQVARSLKIDLASFLEMKSFSQFGSDLDKSTLAILKHGEVLLRVLRQEQYKVRSLSKQVFELYLAKSKLLDELPIENVRDTLEEAHQYVLNNHPEILKDIDEKKEISEDNEKALRKAIDDFFAIKEK